VQQEVGMGNEHVRGPRLTLVGHERDEALRTIRNVLERRPAV
jgi:4-hydroxy-tetrahydrodipicolinate synthase